MATAKKTTAEAVDLFDKLQSEVKEPEPLRVTADLILTCPSKRQLDASQAEGLTEEQSNRILIGDQYDALVELFADQPPHRWVAFNREYLAHFFGDQTV